MIMGGHLRLGCHFMNHESHLVIDVRNPNMSLKKENNNTTIAQHKFKINLTTQNVDDICKLCFFIIITLRPPYAWK